MSHLTSSSTTMDRTDRAPLDKLCTSIRGKLQFMDYLVRAAVADVQRLEAEDDPGTKIFLRQLVEMHTQNLSVECENMRLMGELCHSLEEAALSTPQAAARTLRNGDAA